MYIYIFGFISYESFWTRSSTSYFGRVGFGSSLYLFLLPFVFFRDISLIEELYEEDSKSYVDSESQIKVRHRLLASEIIIVIVHDYGTYGHP